MHDTPGNALDWSQLVADEAVWVVLVRHGRTVWNKERRFLGRTDVPLDDRGALQAKAVADRLSPAPIGRIVSSPLRRAAATAAAIAGPHGLTVNHEDALMELAQGELEGQPATVLAERYPDFLSHWQRDPGTARVPGGETLGECQTRGLAAIRAVADGAEPGRAVVVVSHQMVISSVLCAILGLPLTQFRELGHKNTALSVLVAADGGLHPRLLRDAQHLDGLGPD